MNADRTATNPARWMGLVVLVVGTLALTGCDGCTADDHEELDVVEAPATLTDDQVVAVARLADFHWRVFDTQHWIAEGVQAGAFRRWDDLEYGIPDNPTEQLQQWAGQVVGDEEQRLDWEGMVDVVVWSSSADDELRWAVSVPLKSGSSFADGVDWTPRRRLPGDGQRSTPVFRREVDGRTLWVAGQSVVGQPDRSAVVISNFVKGTAGLSDAVALTGQSGVKPVELYLWPRRTGLMERYRRAGAVIDRQVGVAGHEQPAAKTGLMHIISQFQYALGEPASWPEVVRVAKDVQRDRETGAALSVEFVVDARGGDGVLLSELRDRLVDDEPRRLSPLDGAVAQIDVNAEPGTFAALVDEVIPSQWWRVVTGRSDAALQQVLADLDEALTQTGRRVSFGLFDSPLPRGGSGEVFVAVETSQPDKLGEALAPVHDWLLGEFWMPSLDLHSHIHDDIHEIEVDGRERELTRQVFVIGHGFGVGGVCHTVEDGQFMAYYGVRPCQRLHAILEAGVDREPAQGALTYRGGLKGVVDGLYPGAGSLIEDVIGQFDVDIAADRLDGRLLRLSFQTGDLVGLSRLLDGGPRLASVFQPEELVARAEVARPLPSSTPVYQEPGLAVVGPPGAGFALTGGFVLGAPFSYPPVSPGDFRTFFYAEPGEQPQLGHSH